MSTPQKDLTHRISLEKAIKMTTLYRQQKDVLLNSVYVGKDILPVSETFNRKAFDDLLAQPGCTAVRLYYSLDDSLRFHLIAVGVNDKNEDILPAVTVATISGNDEGTGTGADADVEVGIILEEAARCPPICGEPSPLNS